MNHSPTNPTTTTLKAKKAVKRKSKLARMAPATNGEILVKGVVMGLIISGLTHASKNFSYRLVKNPLALAATGYLTYKYRNEIIVLGNRTAVESKNFVLRQKEHLGDLLSEFKDGNNEAQK